MSLAFFVINILYTSNLLQNLAISYFEIYRQPIRQIQKGQAFSNQSKNRSSPESASEIFEWFSGVFRYSECFPNIFSRL